jgi:hypothetical protein
MTCMLLSLRLRIQASGGIALVTCLGALTEPPVNVKGRRCANYMLANIQPLEERLVCFLLVPGCVAWVLGTTMRWGEYLNLATSSNRPLIHR